MVTFDVFDTLLWRRVLFPADAFGLLPHGRATAWRASVEAAVTATCRRLLRREPRLADIYRFYRFDPAAELAMEVSLAQANPWCLDLVKALLARGVTVAGVSDMYLSAPHIATLLQAAGYPSLPLFVSSEANRSKHGDGGLFLHVGEHLGAKPPNWMHVGDNPHADIAMARRHGLSTCHVKAPRDMLLALLPDLSRQPRTPQQAVFLGEVAIALHVRLAEAAAPPDLAGRLARALAGATDAQAVVRQALAPVAGETLP